MGVIIRLAVRIGMHYTGIFNAFPMRTTNPHASERFAVCSK